MSSAPAIFLRRALWPGARDPLRPAGICINHGIYVGSNLSGGINGISEASVGMIKVSRTGARFLHQHSQHSQLWSLQRQRQRQASQCSLLARPPGANEASRGSLLLLGRESARGLASKGPVGEEKRAGLEVKKDGERAPTKTPLTERIKALTPHENIYTIPNILTFSRLAAAPLIGYLILHDQHAWAIGLFAYAGVTDLVDGWIARKFKQQTVVGTVIDPMADKTLMTILTVALAVKGALPVWCATIIIGRDVLLAISAIYYRWISLPPPKTFARYWDFSLPSAEVHPTGISKINTALQLGLIGWTVCMPMLVGYGPWMETALMGMQYLVASTTVWSGLSYVYSKDAVKILSAKDIAERQRQVKAKSGNPDP